MIIRKIQISDLDNLVELFDSYRQFYKLESNKISAKQFLSERIKNNESVIFVAENKNQELTGFIQLYPLFSSTRMKPLWLLNDLFVEENNRGNKIAIKLIEKAKQLCRDTNACSLTLETAKTNNIGNNLYSKMEFKLDSQNNFYYWNIKN